MRTVLVTGGTGFVAHRLLGDLHRRAWSVRATVRESAGLGLLSEHCRGAVTGPLEEVRDWRPILDGADAVVHLAARAHRSWDDADNTDVDLTRSLAAAACAAGVGRFVCLSSVKAMGESTGAGESLNETMPPRPRNSYGRSKLDSERVLDETARGKGLEVVVLRAPLVYGPGVKANMLRLMKAISWGIPLPLGAVRNFRSLIYVGNLADAIASAMEHPAAAGETFLVKDGEDLSTPELVRRLAGALGRPAKLWRAPPSLLRMAGGFLGCSAETDRLLGSLVLDSGKIQRHLGWVPPYTVDQGIEDMVRWFKSP